MIDYKPLLDKVSGYLNAWAKKGISFAGRRELIGTVLQGVEGFWLSVLPTPLAVRTSLIGICRRFLWRRPRVRWYNICVPRREGGLGLLDLEVWNHCFMLKHYWHIVSRRDSLWVRWVHHRYLGVVEPDMWVPHRRDSPLIKGILHGRDLVEEMDGRVLSVKETLEGWCKGGRFKVFGLRCNEG